MTAETTSIKEAPSSALLASVGELLFGPCWQSALAQALGVSDRTMRYWIAGRTVPAGVRGDLVALMRNRIGALAEAMRAIQRSATPE